MKTWIALFKGINVGGNIIFANSAKHADKLAHSIATAMHNTFGFSTHVLVIDADDMAQAIENNPFTELQSDEDAKRLHVYFLDRVPSAIDKIRFSAVQQSDERWHCAGRFFYLHTPGGAGNSKLATQVEKITGTLATARNWRTVQMLSKMV